MDDDAGQPITSSKLPTKDGHQLRFHSKFELIKKEETKKKKTKNKTKRGTGIFCILDVSNMIHALTLC